MDSSSLKLSFVVIALCLVISGVAQTDSTSNESAPMRIDFYKETCPLAEKIIRSTFQELFQKDSTVAPALIRLAFHDCFVHGCDASVLLVSTDGILSEQKRGPNQSLKHLESVDTFKSRLEEACPSVVSCADIVVLAARESIAAAGGMFYPLFTGRRDSTDAFPDETGDLPSPFGNGSDAIALFAKKGFSEQELVVLLGAHSVGQIHCEFIRNRLQNFTTTGGPDPSIDPEFLATLRARCNVSSAPNPPNDPAMNMDYEGPGKNFGTVYYRSLLKRKGLTFLDQQMTSSEGTRRLVEAYAFDESQFLKDFSNVMIKLCNLDVLIAPMGQVRRNCSRVNSHT